MKKLVTAGAAIAVLAAGAGLVGNSDSFAQRSQASPVVKTNRLNPSEVRGLSYLISQQMADGGWSEGEESQYMRSHKHINKKEVANVADTSMAALAVLRCGNYPNKGEYASNLTRAAQFVCQAIESSDDQSLYVTDVRGTRLQAKLGPYIDTFLAAQFLSEIKGHMPGARLNERVELALNKVIDKIEDHQGKDGRWASTGWAPVHSQVIATRALNRASQVGIHVGDLALQRAESYAKKQYIGGKGGFDSDGSAGVPLYAAGAAISSLQESINTNEQRAGELEKILKSASASKEAKINAQSELKRFDEAKEVQKQAVASVTGKFTDDNFVKGFGCNGGEEFLSYLNISETLLVSDRSDFTKWNGRIMANLNHVQQDDGSWMGRHCITSRTFCTAAALMVLTVDRSPQAQELALKDGSKEKASL